MPKNRKKRFKINKLLLQFKEKNEKLLSEGNVCTRRRSVPNLQDIVHNSKIGGRFKLVKTMSRLSDFDWIAIAVMQSGTLMDVSNANIERTLINAILPI